MTFTRRPLSLEQLLHASVGMISTVAHENGIEVSLETENVGDVVADEQRLQQIVDNLLSNACKFTPEGGSVSVGAEVDNAGRLAIEIRDTGVGMSPDDAMRALAPFVQLDHEFSRRLQGTGLGLPLAKALVELHGGTLDLSSKLGSGTVITIVFPAERVVRREPDPGDPPEVTLTPKRQRQRA